MRCPADGDTAAVLLRLIGRLSAGYRRCRDAGGGVDAAGADAAIESLMLAEAALRYAACPGDGPTRPPQVAVLGPTQTGKSTVVNLLLGEAAAEVSPLAGFTVHPHGFWVAGAAKDDGWTKGLFPCWRRSDAGKLERDALDTYALRAVPAAPGLSAGVLWDTPDFDSLAARQYARGVLEVAALADAYLLVLSKEKYSDLSVWRLLELVEPLGRPLTIVLNKVTPDAEETLRASLRARLVERGQAWGDVPVCVLPYDTALAAGEPRAGADWAVPLRDAVRSSLEAVADAGTRRPTGVQRLLRRHWMTWLAPVQAEQEARAAWQGMVATAAGEFVAAYTRDYLEHPQRYDCFRRATVELLRLLELPRIGGVVGRVRQWTTWPARQALTAARQWWSGRRGPVRAPHLLGMEGAILLDTLDVLLSGLQRQVGRRARPGVPCCDFWLALEQRLELARASIRGTCEQAINRHHEQVSGEVQAAANRLYAALQKSPARLAALRTARATMDVAGILLAVKTGGLSPLDAVWAPATFALTSLLTEGIAGLEFGREARELKGRQRAAVEKTLVAEVLIPQLSNLTIGLDAPGLFGITVAEVSDAGAALAAWEAGS